MTTRRAGFSLAELAVVLLIGGIVASLLLGTLAAQLRLARVVAATAAGADALRTADHVLAGELRRLTRADVRAVSTDSVALRAFRGFAIACTAHGPELRVRYRGDRLPDPHKDSVLVIGDDGTEHALALLDVRVAGENATCTPAPGELLQVWGLSDAPGGAVAALVFESGAYYLTSRALRYRLGAEGRQPLTAELFRAGSGFHLDCCSGDRTAALRTTLVPAEGPAVRATLPLKGVVP